MFAPADEHLLAPSNAEPPQIFFSAREQQSKNFCLTYGKKQKSIINDLVPSWFCSVCVSVFSVVQRLWNL